MKKSDNLDRKNIVQNKDFMVKKKFSQNFLLDENIINNIIDSADIDENTGVIEIGPGLGALTKQILSKAKSALIYEIDTDLIPYLKGFFSGFQNWNLINTDVLKADINEDINTYLKDVSKIVVISNLPYHITTPIIMKFLEEVNHVDSLVMMMQLEVAKRITSEPNTKDYNALSIIIQHQATAKYLFKVPKNVFYPKPNVDSAVIKLTLNKSVNNDDYKGFYKFVHNCFIQRRKTLVNNLNFAYNDYTKEDFNILLKSNGFNPLIRSEALSLENILKLYNDFMNYEKIKE